MGEVLSMEDFRLKRGKPLKSKKGISVTDLYEVDSCIDTLVTLISSKGKEFALSSNSYQKLRQLLAGGPELASLDAPLASKRVREGLTKLHSLGVELE
jgi:hypothetical protein